MSTQLIRARLDSILHFMSPHWSWVNCHMVNFLTDLHWDAYVPEELRKEVSTNDEINECIEQIFWNLDRTLENCLVSSKFKNVIKFKEEAKQHSIHSFQDIVMSIQEFEKSILKKETTSRQQITIKDFLTEKKRHEVEITASLINDLVVFNPWHSGCVVVDAGDGKGYLSSRLALEYGHKVLGIDSNVTNTRNAIERNKKLTKAWSGLKTRAELVSKGITPPRRGRNVKEKSLIQQQITPLKENGNYKTVDKFITADIDFDSLLNDQFPDIKSNSSFAICLTGLHTCGNLAATCLKLFHSQTSCKLMCNIGCCYHLLKEQHSESEFFENKKIVDINQEIGFPLSRYLQKKEIKLGRNARMLAAQSMERTMAAKELPNISLFYRALLELLICEEHPELKDTIQVGRIRKFSNFKEYVELCRTKYPSLKLKNEKVAQIDKLQENSQNKKRLELFYLLRMTFAPILETLILLDRLLYLKELGHSKSFLIPVFDPIVSPRNFAIVSIKSE